MGQTIRFARVDFRNDRRVFGIKDEDRFLHVYIIGKTGTGKSTLIETMALQDLERGNGFALIDPHGDLVSRVAARIPASQRDKVIYLNATDPTQPYGYNPLRHVSEDRIALAASGMMDVFKKMWPDAWGVRMEHILRNVLMALLEQPDATLHDVLRVFSDNEFRKRVAKSLRNETVRTFLLKEFERFSFGYRADGTAPIQNKVGAFLADPLLNRILTAPEKDLHIRRIMDQGQVLLVNLAKGHIWLNPTRMHIVTHLSPKYQAMRNSKNGWTIHEVGMAQLDDDVGIVMQKLKDMGVDDDTIVVFTTDNGTEVFTWPDGGQSPFAQSKGTVFEGGFRVPCMIRWPGKVPAGKVENGIISGLDWFPTFLAAAGNPNIGEELKKGVPADAEGRELQPRCRAGENRGSPGGNR